LVIGPETSGSTTSCYLVRHGDVENPRGVIYGHLPGYPLSRKGQEQARRLGALLAGREIAAIYTSPLERALQTAQLIREQLGNQIPLTRVPGLIEAEFGRYLQGIPYAQIPWRRPRWMAHMVWPGLLPGDESVGSMHHRVDAAIRRGLEELGGKDFVLVSHGDPIQAYWAKVDRRPPWALHRLQCAKGGLLQLTFAQGRLIGKSYLSPAAIEARLNPAPVAAAT
jgi:broad specificity phosphatase PhoE